MASLIKITIAITPLELSLEVEKITSFLNNLKFHLKIFILLFKLLIFEMVVQSLIFETLIFLLKLL